MLVFLLWFLFPPKEPHKEPKELAHSQEKLCMLGHHQVRAGWFGRDAGPWMLIPMRVVDLPPNYGIRLGKMMINMICLTIKFGGVSYLSLTQWLISELISVCETGPWLSLTVLFSCWDRPGQHDQASSGGKGLAPRIALWEGWFTKDWYVVNMGYTLW